jgi:hypothetical protein
MQMKDIIADTAGVEESVTPIIATINSQISIPRAPQIMIDLLPTFSIIKNEIGVEHTLTNVVIKLIRKGLLMV